MILDYLICNQDRHFGNFGAIRDAVTLEWVGFAPILTAARAFGSTSTPQNRRTGRCPAKPFAATQQAQLALARDGLPALNLAALDDCKDEVLAILNKRISVSQTVPTSWLMLWQCAVKSCKRSNNFVKQPSLCFWKTREGCFVMALTQSARFSLRHFYRPCSAPSFVWMPLWVLSGTEELFVLWRRNNRLSIFSDVL